MTNSDILAVTVLPATYVFLSVDAGPPQTVVLPNVATLQPTITGDNLPNGPVNLTWTQASGPGAVTFSQNNGAETAAFSTAGVYDIQIIATDGGLSASNDVIITVYAPTAPPFVEIDQPLDSAIITAPTNIIGTASSPILQSYQVRYRLAPPATNDDIPTASSTGWTTLAGGSASVVNDTLAVFDPTLLLNGIYQVQVVAVDSIGRTAYSEVHTLVVDRNLKIGQFTISFNDLSVPVPGLPMQITRTYDSRAAPAGVQGDFGAGWTMDIRNVRLQKNRLFEQQLGGIHRPAAQAICRPPIILIRAIARIVTITFPDGRVEKFQLVPYPMDQPMDGN